MNELIFTAGGFLLGAGVTWSITAWRAYIDDRSAVRRFVLERRLDMFKDVVTAVNELGDGGFSGNLTLYTKLKSRFLLLTMANDPVLRQSEVDALMEHLTTDDPIPIEGVDDGLDGFLDNPDVRRVVNYQGQLRIFVSESLSNAQKPFSWSEMMKDFDG